VQAGAEGDDLDLHLLAEVLVVLLDVGRVVETVARRPSSTSRAASSPICPFAKVKW
jgi:hypothetical protein